MSDSKDKGQAIVVGAGFGGLAVAIRLQLHGYKVSVLEKNAYGGGKVHEHRSQGFRFDRGPSLFTLPEWMDELFVLAGKNPRDYYQFEQLPLICRYFYPDGTHLDAWAQPQEFAREIAAQTGEDAHKVLRYLDRAAEIYDITADIFLQRSLHKSDTYFRMSTLRSLLRFHKIAAFQTLAGLHERWFQQEKTRQLFNRFATYNGSDPYRAPGTLSIIPHLEHNLGAYYPKGGMHRLTEALLRLCEELGIKIHYQTPVQQIDIRKGKIIGVQTAHGSWPAKIVVCNADIGHAYSRLLPIKAPLRTLQQPRSTSALIFYWGLNRAIPGLDVHNILFSADYKGEFKELEAGRLPEDPTVYLYASCLANPEDAPPGGMNLFAMINTAPALDGIDPDITLARTRMLDKIRRFTGQDIQADIVCEEILTPMGIQEETASPGGALYGNSSNNQFAAFLRHANFRSDVKGLYFTGGSVHPGGGIPLVLASARIVAELVRKGKS